jgi:hypothetical protein
VQSAQIPLLAAPEVAAFLPREHATPVPTPRDPQATADCNSHVTPAAVARPNQVGPFCPNGWTDSLRQPCPRRRRDRVSVPRFRRRRP